MRATRPNPSILEFYRWLVAVGRKVALTTCTRELLTILAAVLGNRIP